MQILSLICFGILYIIFRNGFHVYLINIYNMYNRYDGPAARLEIQIDWNHSVSTKQMFTEYMTYE